MAQLLQAPNLLQAALRYPVYFLQGRVTVGALVKCRYDLERNLGLRLPRARLVTL